MRYIEGIQNEVASGRQLALQAIDSSWMSPVEIEHRLRGRCSRFVIDRILKLNPDGASCYSRPRGWHRKQGPNAMDRDTCGRREYEARWGRGSYAQIPKHLLMKIGGKRRAVPGILYVQGPQS